MFWRKTTGKDRCMDVWMHSLLSRLQLTSLKYPIHPPCTLVTIDFILAPEEEEEERLGNFFEAFHRKVPEYPPSSLPSTSMFALIADVAFIVGEKGYNCDINNSKPMQVASICIHSSSSSSSSPASSRCAMLRI